MALRDQPYFPLYVQDFLTDEKLIECSAEATGVYVRLMCIMHKSDTYGVILLKQKDKQTDNQITNFALKVARLMPYSSDVVVRSLLELIEEKVICIEGDLLIQKRMVKDNKISIIRAEAGKKGGDFAKAKHKANEVANTENEYDTEYEDETAIEPELAEKTKTDSFVSERKELIDELNSLTGRKFDSDAAYFKKNINARIKQYGVPDLIDMIRFIVYKRKGTDFEQYLKPDTIFRPDKCASYIADMKHFRDNGIQPKKDIVSNGKKSKEEMMQDFKAAQQRKHTQK